MLTIHYNVPPWFTSLGSCAFVFLNLNLLIFPFESWRNFYNASASHYALTNSTSAELWPTCPICRLPKYIDFQNAVGSWKKFSCLLRIYHWNCEELKYKILNFWWEKIASMFIVKVWHLIYRNRRKKSETNLKLILWV